MRGFNFGRNWLAFSSDSLDASKISEATESLDELIDAKDIHGKSFLDIGCGSGIFSLAAKNLGASDVRGIDISFDSIDASVMNREKYCPDSCIDFTKMSILEDDRASLGRFNIVYSWGVLHHTGNMWQAIENASGLVSDRGLLVLAIYNKHWSSPFWHGVKYTYNVSPGMIQTLMVYLFYAVIFLAKFLVTFKNPLRKKRGMNFYYDVVDWIGGYPYEYASKEEVIHFVSRLGFKIRKKVSALVPTGCNQFVFEKSN